MKYDVFFLQSFLRENVVCLSLSGVSDSNKMQRNWKTEKERKRGRAREKEKEKEREKEIESGREN